MDCHNCGNEVGKSSKFCRHCGAVLKAKIENSEVKEIEKEEFFKSPSDLFRDIVTIVVVVGLIFGGIFLINALTNNSGGSNQTTTSNKFYVKTVYANIRSCSSTGCNILGQYPQNTPFDLSYSSVENLPDWIPVTWTDNSGQNVTGYISKSVLSISNTQIASNDTSAQQQTISNDSSSNSPKSTTDIVREWRKRTAYVECDWYRNLDDSLPAYYSDSGSGMLVQLQNRNGLSVITNRHVIVDSYYGTATECFVKFPDDILFYGPVKYDSVLHNLTVNIDGSDGGSINNLFDYSGITGLLPLSTRASSNIYVCKTPAETGDPVVILGYPSYGGGIRAIGSIDLTATEGIISGKDGVYYTTSAKIEHGNSGGIAIDKNRDCYLGVPTAAVVGQIESLGRILPASFIFK